MDIKVIIAGPRTFDDYEYAKSALNICIAPGVFKRKVTIISGGCDDEKKGIHTYTRPDGSKVYGADGLGERYAAEYGFELVIFMANWNKYGRSAGPIRNAAMSKEATHAVIFWDGQSSGSSDMIEKAKKLKRVVINYITDNWN